MGAVDGFVGTRQVSCAALIALLATVVVFQETARAVVPGSNGKIAFESYRDGDGEIYVMDPDGSNQTQLTHNTTNDYEPAWSPDGKRIAFHRYHGATDTHQIWVMNADGSGQTNVSNNPDPAFADFEAAWSPGGERIAFSTYGGSPQGEVHVMNADGSSRTNLSNDAGADWSPAWSPDAQRIAFMSNRDGPAEIWVMNADGSAQAPLFDPSLGEDNPTWSPNGQKIGFEAPGSNARHQIHTVNPNGSGRTELTHGTDNSVSPAWSPDGQKIAYSGHAGGDWDIWAMSADGSGPTNLTAAADADFNPDWQPVNVDTDGDGLRDSWETDGIDSDEDGTPELDLPAMGADPAHKDIFLELDVMPGHELSQAAIDDVIAAFATAPVTNPDATPGITLHVDNGPASVMNPAADTWGALSDQDTLAHEYALGTFATPDDYDWADVDAIKAASFSTDREPAFHYIVSGHRYGDLSNDSSGISRGIGASDLLVTLGAASEPGEGSGTVAQQAGTLMHELGHNLGLRHGGDDDRNYKANYLSIMNYAFQFAWLRRANGTSVLDYSRFRIPLNETALDETNGFGSPPASPEAAFVTLAGCPGDPAPQFRPSRLFPTPLLTGALDWNCNELADGTVSADLNDDGVLTSSTSLLDWQALVYDGGAIGSPGGTVALPATSEQIEPQLEELLRSEQALDDPLRPLPAARPPAPTTAGPAKKKCRKGRKLKKGKCVKKRKKKK